MALHTVPLTTERIPDLATLFDQGGDPKWCWCTFFRARSRDWTNSTAADNRAVLERAALTQGHAPGLVGYDGEAAVGWVSLGPREDFERLGASRVLAPLDDEPVWSIVCFVVGRRARRRGVSAELLDAAIDYARVAGATILEAYPVDLAVGERIPSANLYQGSVAMFRRAGFTVATRRQATETARIRPIVRRRL